MKPASDASLFVTIDDQSKRMRDLIDKMLALARLEAPQTAPPEPIDLATIVEAALDEAPFLAKTNDVHVDVRTGNMVLCNPHEMQDAVLNLLVNAPKYAPGCIVKVRLHGTLEDAILEIADEGPGMTPIDRENAFRRFYRGERVRDLEGSGLGLSIVDRVVRRARGTIVVESDVGAGSRFTISLPRVTAGYFEQGVCAGAFAPV